MDNKPKPGFVYFAESTRPEGSKQIYTGMTRRSLWVRWREHMRKYGSKWTSRGTWFKPLGAVWSTNPHKAELTIKKWPQIRKRIFAKFAAIKYRRSQNKF